MSQPSVSHHLSRLRVAEFVQGDRHGKERIYALTDSGRTALDACRRLLLP
jgi:DNA-binding transcriptional ArsR family regulator